MTCKKCGYKDKKEIRIFEENICSLCVIFSPENKKDFKDYIGETIDWKLIDTFRRYKKAPGQKQKFGMIKKASLGIPVTRAPLGYSISNGKLILNENSSKVHSIFTNFLNNKPSLNYLSKNFGLSVNGLKKILTNRTYLGEIKFDGKIHKGHHNSIISPEIFYAVQRKLKNYLRPRKN